MIVIDQEEFVEGVKDALDDLIDISMDDPDADMPAVAFLFSGEKGMAVVPLEHLMTDDLGKEFVGNVGLPKVIDMIGDVQAVAMATTAWRSPNVGAEELAKLRGKYGGEVSKYPGRTEAVFVYFGFPDGTLIVASREVMRNKGLPPTLGEWEDMKPSPWQGGSGRMMDAVMSKLTGRELLSNPQIKVVAERLSRNETFSNELAELLRERGFDIDAMDVPPDEMTPEQKEAFRKASMALPEEFHERMRAQIMEHLPDFGEAQFEEAVRRQKDEVEDEIKKQRDSVARDLRRWLER